MSDLRYALRQLIKHPGFTFAAIATLGLGLAGSAITFAIVNGVLLQPLPYEDPHELVVAWQANPEEQITQAPVSLPNFRDWREQNQVFEDITAWPAFSFRGLLLTGQGEPAELRTGYVAGDFFGVLGVQPTIGRFFGWAEDRESENRVVVLSHRLWRGRFGADSSIVGSSVRLDDAAFTVLGVAPPNMGLPDPSVEIWTPLSVIDSTRISHQFRGLRWLVTTARLAPAVSLERAEQEMSRLAAGLVEAYPDANEGWTAARVVPLREELVDEARNGILLLQGAVVLVLLIACVNVAGLLLARASVRRGELAVRAALGAGRWRLVRQMIVEAVVLGGLAGAIGLVLAAWGLDGVVSLAGDRLPRAVEVQLDPIVVLAIFVTSLAVSVGYGLIPALVTTRGRIAGVLQSGARASAQPGVRITRHLLTSGEIAIAVVLVSGAALLLNSLCRLHRVDPGFDPSGVLAVEFTIPGVRYPTAPEYRAAYFAMLDEVRRLPGVRAAGAAQILPGIGGDEGTGFRLPSDDPSGEPREALWRAVSPGYFETLRIPILAGRAFGDLDGDGPPVAIVNQLLAERLWPGGSAVGEQIQYGEATLQVVGVVGDVRYDGLQSPPEAVLYRPQAQHSRTRVGMVVRTVSDPADLAGAVTAAIRRVEADQPIRRIQALEDVLAGTFAESRALALVLASFAAFALALAALGLFSIISYSVAQRRREIGVRVALGARRRDVLRLVVGEGVRHAAAGVATGVLAVLLGGQLLASQLYGVAPGDPLTIALVVAVLLLTTLGASYLPARAAAALDPMEALRHE